MKANQKLDNTDKDYLRMFLGDFKSKLSSLDSELAKKYTKNVNLNIRLVMASVDYKLLNFDPKVKEHFENAIRLVETKLVKITETQEKLGKNFNNSENKDWSCTVITLDLA